MPDSTEPIVGANDVGLGPWLEFEETGFKVRLSEEYVVLEDHWIPRALAFMTTAQEPQLYFEVKVDENGPRMTEFAFVSRDPDSQGIRQADFRDVQVSAVLEDFVAMFTVRIERDDDGNAIRPIGVYDDQAGLLRFVGRLRAGRTSRDITPQLLEHVAKVYRDNIDRYPTKAVQHHFQVSQRMAAEYVSRARKRGLLPPTKKGKKNA